MSTRADRIAALLGQFFSPVVLHIVDDSARHAGHAGAAPGGQTHFSVVMVAEAFHGQSRVERSRAVHAALAEEFAGGLHALALTLCTPEEHLRAGGSKATAH
jgi:BolA family transcriptional regulator, general stress-responsive regulator